MNRRHVLMAAGLVIAAWLALFGDKTPNGEVAEPEARKTVSSRSRDAARMAPPEIARENASGGKSGREPVILALQSRDGQLGDDAAAEAKALFGSQSWTPPPPPPSKIIGPTPAPVAPPVPYSFIGKKYEDGAWEVYLERDDKAYVVTATTVIDGLYKVESIAPPVLTLQYLPLKQEQQIAIGEGL